MNRVTQFPACAALAALFIGYSEGNGAEISAPAKPADAHKLIDAIRISVPDVAEASREAVNNLKRITVPKGFKLELWAAEPMLGNPVAFCLDEKGRVFVSETYRYRTSVLDIRHYMFMLEEDLACRTVEDRVELIRRNFGKQFEDLKIESEVIRLIEDRDGDGKADFSSIYADKFDSVLDGIASGVLARKGKVYFTNIPHLWELSGIDKEGKAVSRRSLSYGYGVRFSFTGHDMHGLAIGPDGKLYFSIGDRGATVVTKELKLLPYPDEGAVFRCNLDGTEMEVVHRGLRNPQELAFDNYGNLFTGDNDFDHGDEERLVYIAEGGDSGWRVGYQHSLIGYDLVPWKNEHIWMSHYSRQADFNGQPLPNRIEDIGVRPAAYLPPISNVENGPSGLTFYPGTGMPAKYDNHFFLTHFKGNIANSKIQAFSVKPKGAAFELDDSETVVGNLQPTDVEFGPDGAMYFSDWGEGWTRTRKGRIYRMVHETAGSSPIVKETQKILGEGFGERSVKELTSLLGHQDRRVRQEAHLELADRGPKVIAALSNIAKQNGNQFARLHAIWALGIIGRDASWALKSLETLLKDNDAEVRAQAAKVLGEGNYRAATSALIAALNDSSARVKFFAAIGLGKFRKKEALPALLDMIAANNGKDAYLRHAGVMGLVGINHYASLVQLAKHESAAVRMAVLLAFRKLQRPEVAVFLKDKDPRLIIEAARAINDAKIDPATPQLAALINDLPDVPEKYRVMLLLRVINANYRLGTGNHALALAKYASLTSQPAEMRSEALYDLGTWANPHQRDRVMGVYRPLKNRSGTMAASALKPLIKTLLSTAPDDVRVAAAQAAVNLNLTEAGEIFFGMVGDNKTDTKVRIAALNGLAGLKDAQLSRAISLILNQKQKKLRAAALGLVANLDGAAAVQHVATALSSGSMEEKQQALGSVAAINDGRADALLTDWMKGLIAGAVPPGLRLDVLESAEKRASTGRLKTLLGQYQRQFKDGDELAQWKIAESGGSLENGRELFMTRNDVQCLRCHKLNGTGGEAGPDLTGIGAKQPREYLLESIVLPSAKIAPGFETIQVDTKDDRNFAGIIRREDEKELVLFSAEDGEIKVKKSDIVFRKTGLSGMPAGFHLMLGKRSVRDIVEFLASQR